MSFVKDIAPILPFLGIGAGAERGTRGLESDNDFRAARGFTGAGLAGGRLLTSGAAAGSGMAAASGGMAGAGAGLGMAAGITDSMAVLRGEEMSDGAEMGLTGTLGLAGGALGAARPDTLPWLAAGGLTSSVAGMAARDFDASGDHALAAGAGIVGMGGAGMGIGGGIGEAIGGPAGGVLGATIGGAVGLTAGSVMEIANEDAPEERIASVSDDHGITGGEAMGVLGMAGAGALIGSVVPAVGTAVGAGVGAAIGGIGALAAAFWD